MTRTETPQPAAGPRLGKGIYTRAEIATILRMPYGKVNRWVTDYGRVSGEHAWTLDDSLAVDFITLVELAVIGQLMEAGVKPAPIVKSREILQRHFGTEAPFAQKQVLELIRTDGRHIYIRHEGRDLVNLDGTGQLNLDYVLDLIRNLEFDEDLLASRLWPRGRDHSVVVDPARKFGHPVIDGANIYPETLHRLYKGGETEAFIAHLYGLDEKQVRDAIAYCEAA